SSVASVSANGEVKALKPGTATIIVSSSNGKTAKCEVTVNAKVIRMERILLDFEELSLEKGSTHQFTATVYPVETTSPELEWWSDDESIAKVDGNGLVMMIGEGSTIVHVRSVRWPEIEAICRINVTDAVDGIIADDAPCDIYTSGGQLLKKAVLPSEIQYLDRGIYIIRQGGKTTKLLK
ncbi:MAG: Ig-like domain-containing protein, partial [Muribaculaceae bacterium]|nr:Ig-like domain-containing protein [Muribaculaceae bacterium]